MKGFFLNSTLQRAVVFLSIIVFAGCAGMNDDGAIDPTTNGLEGTWEYLGWNTSFLEMSAFL